MPRKRKKNTTPQTPQQSRPAVPPVSAEPNPSAKDTSKTPAPPTPQQESQRQEPKKTPPTFFTESEQDELFTMTERDAQTVARARMDEMFQDETDNIKHQLAAAEAQYRQFQQRSTERRNRRLREAARPHRGRPTNL